MDKSVLKEKWLRCRSEKEHIIDFGKDVYNMFQNK